MGSPDARVVSPADFIPLAEHTGLIVGIGEWVLRAACLQAAEWQTLHPDAGRQHDGEPVHPAAPRAELVAERAGRPARERAPLRCCAQITESAVMADARAASARLRELRLLGVRLAIDDFGTGHSSLAYLRELPVHDLKIAREFVSEMETSPHDLALARGILSLGHGLGLRVIAEGIESESQDALLRGMGCDLGQGYLYARPLAASDVALMLDAPADAPAGGLRRDDVRPTPSIGPRGAGCCTCSSHIGTGAAHHPCGGPGTRAARVAAEEELQGRLPSEVLPPGRPRRGAAHGAGPPCGASVTTSTGRPPVAGDAWMSTWGPSATTRAPSSAG